MAEERRKILEVRDVKKYFPLGKGRLKEGAPCVKAVDGITFDLYEGETLGLVGESGCGKSTLGRTIIRLYEPTAGTVLFEGEDIGKKSRKEMRKLREKMQFIFQDPYSSLNPRMNVFNILAEPLLAHGIFKRGPELEAYVKDLMDKCGLPSYYCYRYPHQFSGGQRQRIGIARSLALNPSFIICDEPVSALDVSIQSQIINLMKDMQEENNISYIFISHDLSVVKHISDRVGVMYLGSMVELASKENIYDNPQHPYTQALIAAIPIPDPTKRSEMKLIEGEIPSNVNTPSGCKFHPRCPFAKDVCKEKEPPVKEVEPEHFVKCWFAGEF
ncbi:ABC transporter ATP-binding protein [uncultured Dubosiella sp.]|jgi:peptide/nickel transport system ATP-binding protein/oligopeptide transport system ATP-binding protein|uniref:ABC transporter ATP-binding protein n=1 Tax=uncultured Dubosiella sp. TaxID=1937011 RepID=UPI000EEA8150|nr:oligopeptide/dipeptide ABC transporter ATP-binding protein [uncultured Dubosiella sp.]GJM59357.1 ABC transporter ATP-binding protein [Erysipelotrichaceae bacterium OPF54]HAM29818.1 peptide ABC transporter substrate-binding protein [Erysipelotrichaceae bacterium]